MSYCVLAGRASSMEPRGGLGHRPEAFAPDDGVPFAPMANADLHMVVAGGELARLVANPCIGPLGGAVQRPRCAQREARIFPFGLNGNGFR